MATEIGDRGIEAAMADNLGTVATSVGDCRAGLEYSAEAADLFRELEDETGISVALLNCGWNALGLGHAVLAEDSFRRGLVVADRLGAIRRIANGALGLAAVFVTTHEEERGAQLLGSAASLREELGIGLYDAFEEQIHEQVVADAKAALGEDAFAAAWARGQAMQVEGREVLR